VCVAHHPFSSFLPFFLTHFFFLFLRSSRAGSTPQRSRTTSRRASARRSWSARDSCTSASPTPEPSSARRRTPEPSSVEPRRKKPACFCVDRCVRCCYGPLSRFGASYVRSARLSSSCLLPVKKACLALASFFRRTGSEPRVLLRTDSSSGLIPTASSSQLVRRCGVTLMGRRTLVSALAATGGARRIWVLRGGHLLSFRGFPLSVRGVLQMGWGPRINIVRCFFSTLFVLLSRAFSRGAHPLPVSGADTGRAIVVVQLS